MWHTNADLVHKYHDSWHKYDFNLLYSDQYWHSALLADVLHRQSHVYSSSLNHWAGYLWMVQPGNESFRVIRESVQPVHWNESALSNIRHCSHGKPWKPFPTFAGVSRGFYCRPNPEDLCFSPTTRVKIHSRITHCWPNPHHCIHKKKTIQNSLFKSFLTAAENRTLTVALHTWIDGWMDKQIFSSI